MGVVNAQIHRPRRAIVVGDIPEILQEALTEDGWICRPVRRPLAALTILADEGAESVVFGHCEEPVDAGFLDRLRDEPAFANTALLLLCDSVPERLPAVDVLLLSEGLNRRLADRALRICAVKADAGDCPDPLPLLLQQVAECDRRLRDQATELARRLGELDDIVRERTRELATSEHTYRGLIDNNPDAAVVLTPGGQILYQNAIASWMLDELEDDSLERALEAFCTPANETRLPLSLRTGDDIVAEIRTATTTWQATPALVATIRDVTDRYRAEEHLRYLATHDELTGLLNRAAFREQVETCFNRASESGEQFAIVFVDLDRFKFVNDSLGHVAGDRLLRYFAAGLSSCLSDDQGTIARIGGDEFAVLLTDIDTAEQIDVLCNRLGEALADPVEIDGVRIYLSFSTGVAIGPGPYNSVDELVRESDRAMYRAKAMRHGQHDAYALVRQAADKDVLRLESALREALQEGHIRAWYQPIVDLQTGTLAGFESLARWHREDGSLVPPSAFIPLAEETGLILKLGQQMLEDACARLAEWARSGRSDVFLSVNLSPLHLLQPNLFRNVSELLTRYGVQPEGLVIEVTEEALLQGELEAESVLGLLSDLGVGIAIDDFGTGYSSLDRLRRMPVQKLKIDRCFVEHIAESTREREICRAIVTLGQNLGMQVVAEGIETSDQARLLRQMGCAAGQGYLFARALEPFQVLGCPDIFADDGLLTLLPAEAA